MTTLPLVMVTGASSGIGAAVARAFSALGHPLLLVSRRLAELQSLDLPNAVCVAADVTDAQFETLKGRTTATTYTLLYTKDR